MYPTTHQAYPYLLIKYLYKYFTYFLSLLVLRTWDKTLLDESVGNFANNRVHAEIMPRDPLWLKIRDRLVFAVQYRGTQLFDAFDSFVKIF